MRLHLWTLLGLLCTTPLWAATYTASPNGNGDCSSGSPCSLDTGLGKLKPGDTLLLKGGDYRQAMGHDGDNPSSGTSHQIPSGTSSQRITIASAPGEIPVFPFIWLSGDYVTLDGQKWDGMVIDGKNDSGLGIAIGGHHVRLKHLEIKNMRDHGVLGCDDGYCEFLNLHVHHIAVNSCFGSGMCHGIYSSTTGNLFDGGEYHDMPNGYGIHPNKGYDYTIRNIRFHHNRDGALVYGSGFKVYNNVFDHNTGSGLVNYGSNMTIQNNTFTDNGTRSIWLPNSGHKIENNIFWDRNALEIKDGGSGSTFGKNLCQSGGSGCDTSGDPKFMNPGSANYRLREGSAAIDAGRMVSEVKTDADGAPRPQGAGMDIGAFEAGGAKPTSPSSPPPTAPPTSTSGPVPPPTNLRVGP